MDYTMIQSVLFVRIVVAVIFKNAEQRELKL
jgi:hypothetical protein